MSIAILTPTFSFAAFILLLLVSLSVPIIKAIHLFVLKAAVDLDVFAGIGGSAEGAVNFGVFGYCIPSLSIDVASINHTSAQQCVKTGLGFTIDDTIAQFLNIEQYKDLINGGITAALVLHPIACGLAFLTLLLSLFTVRPGSSTSSRWPAVFTFISGFLAALIATIAFLVDVIAVAVLKGKVRDETDGQVTLDWGNGVWITLAAAISLWIALFGVMGMVCGCGGNRSRRMKTTDRY